MAAKRRSEREGADAPSLRKDRNQWVELERVGKTATMFKEAKRPETRARRIAGTVERVRKGLPQR